MKILRLRRLVQVLILLLLVAVPWLNAHGWNHMRGTLLAFDFFGLPFADPMGLLQTLLNGVSPGWRLLTGGALVLLLAALLGRFFCSWICPYGLLSECVHSLTRRDAGKPGKPRGFVSRLIIAALGLVLALWAGAPLLNQLSLPGGISLALLAPARPLGSEDVFPAFTLVAVLLILVLLIIEAVIGKRFWCRSVCPQSLLLSLASLSPLSLRVHKRSARCVCDPRHPGCRAACSMNLEPRALKTAARLDCTNCGDCVKACTAVHAQPGSEPILSLRWGPHKD